MNSVPRGRSEEGAAGEPESTPQHGASAPIVRLGSSKAEGDEITWKFMIQPACGQVQAEGRSRPAVLPAWTPRLRLHHDASDGRVCRWYAGDEHMVVLLHFKLMGLETEETAQRDQYMTFKQLKQQSLLNSS
jgi:hypothetical protein